MNITECATRQRILDAGLKHFAECGYAGTSISDIVNTAQVAKPTLYYYFQSKAGLYQSLIDFAYDERYRLMQEAVKRGKDLREKLVEILAAGFDFIIKNRELVRLSFVASFASPGELPPNANFLSKRERNFEFIHALIREELEAGRLSPKFESKELAFGFQGLMSVYFVSHIVMPENKLDRNMAERIVELFLSGARH